MARMTPGAPSLTTSRGSPSPRARMSWKNARTVSVSSFEPAIRWSRTLRPSSLMPQAAITASRGWPARSRSAIPLGQIAFAEGLVLRPQPLGDLAHCRTGQQPAAALVPEGVFDVAGRQPACIEFDSQMLERLRATSKILSDRRHERLGRVAHLRRGELDHSFGRLHLTRPISIPIALGFAIGPLVALAPDFVANFALQGFLQDQPGRQQHQARPVRRGP